MQAERRSDIGPPKKAVNGQTPPNRILPRTLGRGKPVKNIPVPDRAMIYVRKNYAEPASYAFEIERAGMRILGNVAVNHYAVHLKWKDGKKRSMRITHTWVREENGWKVLGGMSTSQ